jgi:hypothetical protein
LMLANRREELAVAAIPTAILERDTLLDIEIQ